MDAVPDIIMAAINYNSFLFILRIMNDLLTLLGFAMPKGKINTSRSSRDQKVVKAIFQNGGRSSGSRGKKFESKIELYIESIEKEVEVQINSIENVE